MKNFNYTAQCEWGAAISGTLEAPDTQTAMDRLTSMRLTNIELTPSVGERLKQPVGGDDFIFFNEQLASLASTGIALDVGLRQLARDVESKRLRRVIESVAASVEKGQPLESAINEHAARLPAFYARVVRAGVESGQLPGTLLNLSQHLRLMSETKRIIRDTLSYPLVILILASAIFSLFAILVVPQFRSIFADWDVQLPALTRSLILTTWGLPYMLGGGIIVVAALVAAWVGLGASSGGRLLRERVLLRLPLIGLLVRESQRSRFLRASAAMVEHGVVLPEAVRLAGDATGGEVLRRDAEEIAGRIEKGVGAFAACEGARLVPPMFGYVVDVSGPRGRLPDALSQLAATYESSALQRQSVIRGWLAPLGIVFVGLMIGLFILAMVLPLTSLIQSVS